MNENTQIAKEIITQYGLWSAASKRSSGVRFWYNNFNQWYHQQNFIKELKLYSRCGHVTKFCLIYHFYERSYHNWKFLRIWPKKLIFLRGGLGTSSIIWTYYHTRYGPTILGMASYGPEILQLCGKKIQTKSQKYWRKLAGNPFALPPPPILNRNESGFKDSRPEKTIKEEKYMFHCVIACNVEVSCFTIAIILENMFGNIKSATFPYGVIGERELYCWACMFADAQYQPP